MPDAPVVLDPSQITGLVLAGGRGSRMGGVDKGLAQLEGRPLAAHALERLRPQVGTLMISANRHLPSYEAFGVPVVSDEQADYPGPLAGFLSGLRRCTTPWLLTVACDTPHFPADLAQRLAAAALAEGANIAVACGPDTQSPIDHVEGARSSHKSPSLRVQPAFCLLRSHLHETLARYLAEGGRRIQGWIFDQGAVRVPFDRPGDDPSAFFNANTAEDLHALARAQP